MYEKLGTKNPDEGRGLAASVYFKLTYVAERSIAFDKNLFSKFVDKRSVQRS